MDRYEFMFFVRFLLGGAIAMVAMFLCMGKGLELSGGQSNSILLVVEAFAAPLYFFAYYRLRPFREFRAGLRIELPDWDWGRDIASASIATAASTGLWMGAVMTLENAGMYPAAGGVQLWSLFAALFAATWILSWAVCKPAGLLPEPLNPGWGE